MKGMHAGEMDRRVTLRRADVTTNDFGEDIETWSDYATVWAARTEVSNRERFAAQQVGAELVARYRIRYSHQVAALSAQDRLVADGREHNITGVAMIGRREGWEITAVFREGAPYEALEPVPNIELTHAVTTDDDHVVTTG